MGRKRTIYPILLAVYLAAVGYICFAHTNVLPTLNEDLLGLKVDKIVHFSMFLPFVFLFLKSLAPDPSCTARPLRMWAMLTLLGIFFTGATELVQMLIPSRAAELGDFIADISGLSTGSIITLIIIKHQKYGH